MPFALVPLIDTDEVNAFGKTRRRFLGADAEEGANLVRIAVDQAILWLPTITLADAKATVLADSPDDTISAARRTALNTLAGDRTFKSTDRVKDIIFNLLRQAPVGKWAPLMPTRDGKYELWLGPGGVGANLLASELTTPDGPHSKDIQDTFTGSGNLNGRTSSDALFTWSIIVGTPANEVITGGHVEANGNGNGLYLASQAMDTANHYIQVELVEAFGGSTGTHRQDLAAWFRANDPDYTHAYDFTIRNGANPRRFFEDVANSVEIAFDTTTSATGTLYVEMSGSTYTAKLNGSTIFNGTDTTHTGAAGQRNVLVNAYREGTPDAVFWDNFRAADLAASSTLAGSLVGGAPLKSLVGGGLVS